MTSPDTQNDNQLSPPCKLSVIVPVWGSDLEDVRDLIEHSGSRPGDGIEWIVAAAGEPGSLRELAATGRIQLVECTEPSRGRQMNDGAAASRGAILCFNHVDTHLEPTHLTSLPSVDAGIVGGAFHRRFDDGHRWMLRWEIRASLLEQQRHVRRTFISRCHHGIGRGALCDPAR